MVWRFLKHYGMNKASGILDDFASAVIAFDPQTASKAQILMMETELDKLGKRVAEAEAELRREHRETLELKQIYEQYMAAAQILEAKLSAEGESDKSADTEASLVRIIEKLELMKPEIEREEREDLEAEAWRGELRHAFEELAQKIRNADNELRSACRQMDVANLQKDRAVDQDYHARAAAGLTSSISSLSVALDSMNQETARVRAETEALKLKAGLLQTDRLDSDPNIAAALAAARGAPVVDRGSLSARLAALSGRAPERQLTPAA